MDIIKQDCQDILKRINVEQLRSASILLTGANGLLGTYIACTIYLANKIHSLNCKLYCTSLNKPNKRIESLLDDRNVIFIQADLSKQFDFNYKVDYIFHSACYGQPKKFLNDKLKTISLNVDVVKSLLAIAKENKAKFMFFSSGAIYGYEYIPEEVIPIPESYNGNCSTTEPRAVYCESKRLGETICSVYREDYGVNVYIVRIGYVYGPGISINDDRVLGDFIRKALVDRKIIMIDDGNSVKIFGYILDIIYMILRIMLEGKDFIYNVGGIDSLSIRNLAEWVAKESGNVPVITSRNEGKFDSRISNNKRFGLDISKFIKEFGQVNFTPFSEGIKRTIAWNIKEFNLLLENERESI